MSLAPLPPAPTAPMFSFSLAEMRRGRAAVQPVKRGGAGGERGVVEELAAGDAGERGRQML